jgi:protein-S-isoprenylcysteine O-methyltransferase Ste14
MNPGPYYKLFIFWALYFSAHSFFAGNYIKKKAKISLGRFSSYYRVIYVILSSAALLIPFIILIRMKQEWIFQGNLFISCTGVVLITTGLILFRDSFRIYSLKEFIGTYYIGAENPGTEKIKMAGILSHIRHPLYAGTILAAVGYLLVLPSVANLLSVFLIILYTLIGMKIEEKKLSSEFGAEYREYMKKVPALIPRIKFKFRNQKSDKTLKSF